METSQTFKGDNKLLFGIFLGVITFWLFASSLVNIVPDLESSFDANYGTINVAVSLTSLLCGYEANNQKVITPKKIPKRSLLSPLKVCDVSIIQFPPNISE